MPDNAKGTKNDKASHRKDAKDAKKNCHKEN